MIKTLLLKVQQYLPSLLAGLFLVLFQTILTLYFLFKIDEKHQAVVVSMQARMDYLESIYITSMKEIEALKQLKQMTPPLESIKSTYSSGLYSGDNTILCVLTSKPVLIIGGILVGCIILYKIFGSHSGTSFDGNGDDLSQKLTDVTDNLSQKLTDVTDNLSQKLTDVTDNLSQFKDEATQNIVNQSSVNTELSQKITDVAVDCKAFTNKTFVKFHDASYYKMADQNKKLEDLVAHYNKFQEDVSDAFETVTGNIDTVSAALLQVNDKIKDLNVKENQENFNCLFSNLEALAENVRSEALSSLSNATNAVSTHPAVLEAVVNAPSVVEGLL